MNRSIDHIVYGVPNLEEAIDYLHGKLGVKPVMGGRHLHKGTKNALLSLGGQCYLEILARDEENDHFTGMRWMGMDQVIVSRIIRWSLKSADLARDSKILRSYSSDYGQIEQGSREVNDGQLLQWQMILPADGPVIDVIPFVTDWSDSATHPEDALEKGCFLRKLELSFPEDESIEKVITALGATAETAYSNEMRIKIFIDTPKGVVELS